MLNTVYYVWLVQFALHTAFLVCRDYRYVWWRDRLFFLFLIRERRKVAYKYIYYLENTTHVKAPVERNA